MNIIFICNELPPGNTGGIGTFVNELTRKLALRGHNIFIVGFLDKIKNKETTNINGINLIKLPLKKGLIGSILNRIILYKEIKKLCLYTSIDIIEVPDFEGWGCFLPKGKHKIIVRLHGSHTYFSNEMGTHPSRIIKKLEKISLIKADHVISVSRYTANKTNLIFKIKKNIHVIYNGINLPEITKCKNDWDETCKVVFTGTLMKKKGVFSLAKAWPIVKKEIPNAKLVMIGKDTIENGHSAKNEIIKISKDENIIFHGHLPKPEMEDIIIKCDVAIYPSYSETFGLAPIEAMALRVPTIYTKLSCGPEIVKTKDLIDICIDPDNFNEIADILIKLLRNKNLRYNLAKKGRLLVEDNYSIDSKIIENENFYKEIVKNA